MALSISSLTGCSKEDTQNPSTNNNVTDNTINNETDNNTNNPVQNDTEDNTNTSKVTVDDILSSIKEAYGENYLPNVEMTSEFIDLEFGLTSDMYEEIKAEQPMISTHPDRVVIVKAAEGKADDVEAALIAAKDKLINDTFQYPMNLPKINATQIVRNGDYVAFLMVGAINENMDATEEEAKLFAEEEVEKAVNAFNNLFK